MVRGGGGLTGRDNRDRDGGAGLLTNLLGDPAFFPAQKKKVREGMGGKKPKGRETFPNLDPPIKRGPNYMRPSSDVEADRRRLREALHDKIDEVQDTRDPSTYWKPGERKPCMSAVWDRESGRVYYNRNSKNNTIDETELDRPGPDRNPTDKPDPRDPETVYRDDLHPLLRDRYDEYKKHKDGEPSTWKTHETDQSQHGDPGTHSETKATNQALHDAEDDYAKGDRDSKPKLEDFMVDNAAPNNKKFMPCCPQCTQMIDGVDGADAGWVKDEFGNKKHREGARNPA